MKSKPHELISKAASMLGKKSAKARMKKWGRKEFRRKMQDWGKLGGRPRKVKADAKTGEPK